MSDSTAPDVKRLKTISCEEGNHKSAAAKTLRKESHEDNNNDKDNLFKEANNALQESIKIHVRPIVDETKLGIEIFVGSRDDEFHGLVKTRYADFMVHEIDLEGNVARLTSLEAPEEEVTESSDIGDILDNKAVECIAEVNDGFLDQYLIDVTGMDKETRTSLHHAIRIAFEKVESSTMSDSELKKSGLSKPGSNQEDDSKHVEPDSSTQQVGEHANGQSQEPDCGHQEDRKYIVVRMRNKVSRPKNNWPRDRPDHTHFILYKENKDTMDAIHNLAAAINTRPSNFSSAGVKDRRAVTTQWVSSWRLEPRRLIAATRRFNKRPYLKVGDFCFKKEPLRLGQLKGNRFNIVIRHLVYNSRGAEVIKNSMKSIEERGFVNYFGLQRFGTRTIQTHEIGLCILQAQWEKAVDMILSYRFDDNRHPPSEKEKTVEKSDINPDGNYVENSTNEIQTSADRRGHESKKYYEKGAEQHNLFIDLWKLKLDAEIVFKKYPHFRFTNEGIIMKSLSKSEESSRDYKSALLSLPRNTRSLYVHSYQSLIWNKAATYRFKRYGFEVVTGDLVIKETSNAIDQSIDALLSSAEVDIDPHEDSMKAKKIDTTSASVLPPFEELNSRMVVVTEENKKDYTIFDVVLPLVGSRVRLPENDVGLEFKKLLEADNLTLESFRACEKFFVSYGSYRKIMVKPSNVNWRIEQYSNPHQSLIETDLDALVKATTSIEEQGIPERHHMPPTSDSSDEALIVEFDLPPSAYATMYLREIMKKPSTDFNKKF